MSDRRQIIAAFVKRAQTVPGVVPAPAVAGKKKQTYKAPDNSGGPAKTVGPPKGITPSMSLKTTAPTDLGNISEASAAVRAIDALDRIVMTVKESQQSAELDKEAGAVGNALKTLRQLISGPARVAKRTVSKGVRTIPEAQNIASRPLRGLFGRGRGATPATRPAPAPAPVAPPPAPKPRPAAAPKRQRTKPVKGRPQPSPDAELPANIGTRQGDLEAWRPATAAQQRRATPKSRAKTTTKKQTSQKQRTTAKATGRAAAATKKRPTRKRTAGARAAVAAPAAEATTHPALRYGLPALGVGAGALGLGSAIAPSLMGDQNVEMPDMSSINLGTYVPPQDAAQQYEDPLTVKTPEPEKQYTQLGNFLNTVGSGGMEGIANLLQSLSPDFADSLRGWAGDRDISQWVGGGGITLGTILALALLQRLLGGGGD